MTDREAIEGLEYLISPSCTDNHADYIQEIAIAISALKEREERSKGCGLCGDYDFISNMVCYVPTDSGGSYEPEINFCPMCGRPLKG